MPFKSAKQAKFFNAIAHGMKPKKGGPSQKVAQKFVKDSGVVDKDKNTEAVRDADEGGKQLSGPSKKPPMFGKGHVAMAGHHPKARGKKR